MPKNEMQEVTGLDQLKQRFEEALELLNRELTVVAPALLLQLKIELNLLFTKVPYSDRRTVAQRVDGMFSTVKAIAELFTNPVSGKRRRLLTLELVVAFGALAACMSQAQAVEPTPTPVPPTPVAALPTEESGAVAVQKTEVSATQTGAAPTQEAVATVEAVIPDKLTVEREGQDKEQIIIFVDKANNSLQFTMNRGLGEDELMSFTLNATDSKVTIGKKPHDVYRIPSEEGGSTRFVYNDGGILRNLLELSASNELTITGDGTTHSVQLKIENTADNYFVIILSNVREQDRFVDIDIQQLGVQDIEVVGSRGEQTATISANVSIDALGNFVATVNGGTTSFIYNLDKKQWQVQKYADTLIDNTTDSPYDSLVQNSGDEVLSELKAQNANDLAAGLPKLTGTQEDVIAQLTADELALIRIKEASGISMGLQPWNNDLQHGKPIESDNDPNFTCAYFSQHMELLSIATMTNEDGTQSIVMGFAFAQQEPNSPDFTIRTIHVEYKIGEIIRALLGHNMTQSDTNTFLSELLSRKNFHLGIWSEDQAAVEILRDAIAKGTLIGLPPEILFKFIVLY